jgi:hypothetical protein
MNLGLISPRDLGVSCIYALILPRVVEIISNIGLFLRSLLKKLPIVKHYIFYLRFNCTKRSSTTCFGIAFRFISEFSHNPLWSSSFHSGFQLGEQEKVCRGYKSGK